MKKFYKSGIEKIEKEVPIHEGLGALLLGLFAVLGITLRAAIRSCKYQYEREPDLDEDDLRNAQTKAKGLKGGTRRSFDEISNEIDTQNNSKDAGTPPPLPTDDKDGKDQPKTGLKDGDIDYTDDGEDDKAAKDTDESPDKPKDLTDRDPKDASTKQLVDVANVLAVSDEALDKGSQRNKIGLLFEYIRNTGATQEMIKADKTIKETGNDDETVNHVVSRCLVNLYQGIFSKDPKRARALFMDVNVVSGIQEMICLQMIFNNEQKSTKLEQGTFTNISKILEV